MNLVRRPLPIAIAVMALLVGVKTVGLVEAIRIGSPARASTVTQKPETKSTASAHAKNSPSTEVKPPAPEQAPPPTESPISEAERATLQDLRTRRSQLDAQSTRLDEREAILSAAERRLTDRIQQLTALQTKLEELEKERKEREQANWNGLVKTYETMRPRDAAVIFNDLETPILMQVLDRMKAAKAAPILAAMIPDRARAATAQLAEWRNQVSGAPRLSGNVQGGK